jgi:hypothetical protein
VSRCRRPLHSRMILLSLSVGFLTAGCRAEPRVESPPRPRGVPSKAFWLGGPDGGVWIALLSKPGDSGRKAIAQVFRQNGSMSYAGVLVLTPEGTPPVDLTDHSQLAGWEGAGLRLKDGRILKVVPGPLRGGTR